MIWNKHNIHFRLKLKAIKNWSLSLIFGEEFNLSGIVCSSKTSHTMCETVGYSGNRDGVRPFRGDVQTRAQVHERRVDEWGRSTCAREEDRAVGEWVYYWKCWLNDHKIKSKVRLHHEMIIINAHGEWGRPACTCEEDWAVEWVVQGQLTVMIGDVFKWVRVTLEKSLKYWTSKWRILARKIVFIQGSEAHCELNRVCDVISSIRENGNAIIVYEWGRFDQGQMKRKFSL